MEPQDEPQDEAMEEVTLRDLAALVCLHAILTREGEGPQSAAKQAVVYADALMEALA